MASHVYVILTPSKVHIYGAHARAIAVHDRAKRMGAKDVQFTQADVKSGATKRHRKAAAESMQRWLVGEPCRCEPSPSGEGR